MSIVKHSADDWQQGLEAFLADEGSVRIACPFQERGIDLDDRAIRQR